VALPHCFDLSQRFLSRKVPRFVELKFQFGELSRHSPNVATRIPATTQAPLTGIPPATALQSLSTTSGEYFVGLPTRTVRMVCTVFLIVHGKSNSAGGAKTPC
jgi:hypothetical protein